MTGYRLLLAGLLAIALPIALVAGSSSYFFPMTTARIDTEKGEGVFAARCGACHDVEGGSGARMGPSLVGIGSLASTRREGMDATAYLFESILDPAAYRHPGVEGHMPSAIAASLGGSKEKIDANVRNLVAYLAELGGEPEYKAIHEYPIPVTIGRVAAARKVDLEQAEAGKRLFEGKGQCSTCHSLVRHFGDGLNGPSLLDAGSYDEAHLRESILDPNAKLVPGYAQVLITTIDGEPLVGRVLHEDEQSVRMYRIDSQGVPEVRDLARSDIAVLEVTEGSRMPSYRGVLTDEEIDALVAFLRTLLER